MDGGMVSISKVMVTPDLMEARIYLSFFKIKDPKALAKKVRSGTKEWRHLLGNQLRNQLRRIPELFFYEDDTLDYVFHMENVFNKIKEDEARLKDEFGDKTDVETSPENAEENTDETDEKA